MPRTTKTILAVPRAKWHRPTDRWQVKFNAGFPQQPTLVAYPTKPKWDPSIGFSNAFDGKGDWHAGVYNGPNGERCNWGPVLKRKPFSHAEVKYSLSRIAPPTKKAKKTRSRK